MKLLKNILHSLVKKITPAQLKKHFRNCEEMAIYLCGNPKLSKTDKVFIQAHLYICKNCRSFKAQIVQLDKFKDSNLKSILEETVDNNRVQSIAYKIKKSL